MNEVFEKNKLALQALEEDNEVYAVKALRENAQKYPCCMTLNNLGVYYSTWGMLQKNGKIKNASKVGLRHLLKASELGADWRNCANIADVFYRFNNIEKAEEYYSAAYQLHQNELVLYNKVVCLYRFGRYKECIEILKSLCISKDIEQFDYNGGQNPFIILANCYLKINDLENCKKCIKHYSDIWNEDMLDVFELRHSVGEYEEALSECERMIKEWYVNKNCLARLADCLEYAPQYRTAVHVALDDSKLQKELEKLGYDKELRMKLVNEDEYWAPIIGMGYFIEDYGT